MLLFLLSLIEGEENRQLFTNLYLQYRPLLFQMSYKYLYHKNEVADCVQETFLALIQRFDSFIKLSEQQQKRYLLTVCKRCAIRLNGKHRQLPPDYYDRFVRTDDPTANQSLESADLEAALEKLDEVNLQILLMKYLEGCSLKEISEALGLSEKAVKQRLYRTRKALQIELESEGGADDVQ
ncbi:MAG: sigma-70 family RNA polymerase sigma factor [Clostridia bacterium]|nr:sigma-70 family RNA polymerase sigma factor [Clostridia bacterium]